jgi:hypothetical protein
MSLDAEWKEYLIKATIFRQLWINRVLRNNLYIEDNIIFIRLMAALAAGQSPKISNL